ncbi:hypothetical protein HAX54_017889 [Datura stramonium]|uniref:Putative plant transposon protein domain-containing protein n=1 Tax=Datura stramonium TaxID=4076 RepID=A0ABS8ULE9_DATST|nr:hypothetical protein [Datura stramonium]
MGKYYVAFKEKRSIHAEAQFEVDSFKNAFPNIYDQIGMRNWDPFTIPVDPYFLELVWEFYASYRSRQQLIKHKGRRYITMPIIGLVARARGAYNSRGNQFALLGGSNPITLDIPQEGGKKVNQFKWVANMIALSQPQWVISRGLIHRRDLKFEARMWLDLVCSRLLPS